ncbi:EAL domain-containing protein [Peribacillus sp. NPDC097675]|uniref:EAL domain-containing protein n=1 Tax=Peribacillus sp. NPDC097675 TaxID=3390618 RepID=UPI003D00B17D
MASLQGKRSMSLGKWFRLFSPSAKLRFYPPQFTIRKPMVRAVAASLSEGYEVAVIVFHVKELFELKESGQQEQFHHLNTHLKRIFKEVVIDKVHEGNLLTIHDYYADGITILMNMEESAKQLIYMEELIRSISDEVRQGLVSVHATPITLSTGYMFVEHEYYSTEGAIDTAQRHAVSMAEAASPMNEMQETINRIIDNGDINLLAQPIFDVATNKIKAYEVLTRGPRDTDLESPLSLFAVARQTGRLYDLEKVVLEKSFKQISENESSQNVFINFTPVTLSDPRFVPDVKDMLHKYKGVYANQIVMEITERDPILNIEEFIESIKGLRKMGFRLAIDDTGVGYSSLYAIIEIMPEIIKIDRSVIENIDHDSVKETMLKGLLLIAKETGSVVVAEGIESIGEAMVLSRNSVDLAQGYYYARPSTVDKISISS